MRLLKYEDIQLKGYRINSELKANLGCDFRFYRARMHDGKASDTDTGL